MVPKFTVWSLGLLALIKVPSGWVGHSSLLGEGASWPPHGFLNTSWVQEVRSCSMFGACPAAQTVALGGDGEMFTKFSRAKSYS